MFFLQLSFLTIKMPAILQGYKIIYTDLSDEAPEIDWREVSARAPAVARLTLRPLIACRKSSTLASTRRPSVAISTCVGRFSFAFRRSTLVAPVRGLKPLDSQSTLNRVCRALAVERRESSRLLFESSKICASKVCPTFCIPAKTLACRIRTKKPQTFAHNTKTEQNHRENCSKNNSFIGRRGSKTQ